MAFAKQPMNFMGANANNHHQMLSLMTFLGCCWRSWGYPHSFHSWLTEDPETKPFPLSPSFKGCRIGFLGFHLFLPISKFSDMYRGDTQCLVYASDFCLCLLIPNYAYAPRPCQVQVGKGGSTISPRWKVLLKLHNKSWKQRVWVLVFKSSRSFVLLIYLSVSFLLFYYQHSPFP